MRPVTEDDTPPQGQRSRLQATPGGPPGARNWGAGNWGALNWGARNWGALYRGMGACAAFWTSARMVVRRMDGGCRAAWEALPPNALDLLWPLLLVPSQRPALQTVPVSRLSCGLDPPQFPSRGSRADVFWPPEVLLTFPGLPDYAARLPPSPQPFSPRPFSRPPLSPRGSGRSWTSWLRRWFRH